MLDLAPNATHLPKRPTGDHEEPQKQCPAEETELDKGIEKRIMGNVADFLAIAISADTKYLRSLEEFQTIGPNFCAALTGATVDGATEIGLAATKTKKHERN